jgi:hypothetical protein
VHAAHFAATVRTPADNVPAVSIEPDTKDWTWVLQRPCPECGYDASTVAADAVASRLRLNATSWRAVLARPTAAARPHPDVWSPLEYACHVRDVHELYLQRLDLMLTEDDPVYENWDQDVTAVERAYGEQDPASVAVELDAAATQLADRFDQLAGEEWHRPGRRSDGASFTVASFARYLLHDVEHHQWDVR